MNIKTVLWVSLIAAGTFWVLNITKNDAILFS